MRHHSVPNDGPRLTARPANTPFMIAGGLRWLFTRWNPWCCVAFPSPVAARPSICASVPAWSRSYRSRRSTTPCIRCPTRDRITPNRRSEEHTSELQSHLNLVCRLLLEKKKNKTQHNNRHH